MIEEPLRNEEKKAEIGDNLDPENEQDIGDCLLEDHEMHPDFEHLDPFGLDDPGKDRVKTEKTFKPINIGCIVELREQ